MASNEERREVAAQMREIMRRSPNCFLENMVVRSVLDVMRKGVTIGETVADLIDRPTCNIDVMTTGERADYECSEHIMRCLNCGAEFGYVLYSEDGDVSMDDKPNYCPQCGAEVVE